MQIVTSRHTIYYIYELFLFISGKLTLSTKKAPEIKRK
ncbi:hypothetical protein CLOL250_02104 [Clostridium sp. L2-50]|nr:hypothetical protein CLOL250_02104 [Clostridium sp. L2-50]